MQTDTKHRLLNTSEALFAKRGFYGVSIAAIAKEMGFSKQALLHHYPTKEKLYGAVLQRISNDFLEQQLEAEQASRDPLERLKTFYLGLAKPSPENIQRTRLLMRELLDNNARSEHAENWYLRDFLQRLIIMTKSVDTLQNLSDEEALIIVYQMLGAINYFLVSPSTLQAIFGDTMYEEVNQRFTQNLALLIEASINLSSSRSAG
ncbi:MAG: hypothetical protein CNF01_09525 [Halieaceae bacterium MED-G27]|jgi:AcrR family transcriptional regulator|nr:MAG: hypothetical protein CNF01_09525 [Halieaceae bacterium MED-G27]|tara:strand:- start:1570 stop:2184 length:615 start_codon:yes stop_codon:yes gene_type:complete